MRPETGNQKPETALRLASLLSYPRETFQPLASDCDEVNAFFDEVGSVDPSGLEELYTTTFDLNPVATLEIGWHLWGEQYERGRFLADLRGLQAEHGIFSECELPDHLTVLLPTIAVAGTPELRAQCAKAIDKILAPLEEHGNPYRHLLRAARVILSREDGEGPVSHTERRSSATDSSLSTPLGMTERRNGVAQ